MPVSLFVTHVTRDKEQPPHRQLKVLHGALPNHGEGVHWSHTHEQVMANLQQNFFKYFVLLDRRTVPLVLAYTAAGERFIKANTDGSFPATLLALPEFDTDQ